jgi:hypothetical protein
MNNFSELNDKDDFILSLYNNRSAFFPKNPNNGDFFMNLNSKIYIFMENKWEEVEAFDFDKNFKMNNFDIFVASQMNLLRID